VPFSIEIVWSIPNSRESDSSNEITNYIIRYFVINVIMIWKLLIG